MCATLEAAAEGASEARNIASQVVQIEIAARLPARRVPCLALSDDDSDL